MKTRYAKQAANLNGPAQNEWPHLVLRSLVPPRSLSLSLALSYFLSLSASCSPSHSRGHVSGCDFSSTHTQVNTTRGARERQIPKRTVGRREREEATRSREKHGQRRKEGDRSLAPSHWFPHRFSLSLSLSLLLSHSPSLVLRVAHVHAERNYVLLSVELPIRPAGTTSSAGGPCGRGTRAAILRSNASYSMARIAATCPMDWPPPRKTTDHVEARYTRSRRPRRRFPPGFE